jgi:hypothetical protein
VNLNHDAEHEITIPQPKAAEIYYTCCSKVEMHNRDRQDTLGIEKSWVPMIGQNELTFDDSALYV